MLRILAIDPSGTGTTGICLIEDNKITFRSYQNPHWETHLNFLISEIEAYHPSLILYESTNYINSRGPDMTSLLKLMGAIEGLTYTFPQIQNIETILVNQVKELKTKLLKGTKQIRIDNLTYQLGRGKGWFFANKKISNHELDAFLVYFLWRRSPCLNLSLTTLTKP